MVHINLTPTIDFGAIAGAAFSPDDLDNQEIWLRASDQVVKDGGGTATDGTVIDSWTGIESTAKVFSEATNPPRFRNADASSSLYTDGLVVRYKLDDPSEVGTLAIDNHGAVGVNARAAIQFDGSNDILRHAGSISDTAGHLYLLITAGSTAFAADQALVSSADEGTANNYWWCGIDANGKVFVESNAGGTVNRATAAHILQPKGTYRIEIASDGSNWTVWIDDILQPLAFSSSDTGDWLGDVAGADNVVIGALKTSGGEASNYEGKVAETILYSDSLTYAERQDLHGYFESRYSFSAYANYSPANSRTLTDSAGSFVSSHAIKVALTNTNFTFSHTLYNAKDIRVFDQTRQQFLSYWIARWDPETDDADVWFNATRMNNLVHLLYDDPSASADESGAGVFSLFDDFNHRLWTGWTKLTDIPDTHRQPGVAVVDDILYITGGYTAKARKYDFTTSTWASIADMPASIQSHVCRNVNGTMYSTAGMKTDATALLLETYKYNVGGNSWDAMDDIITGREDVFSGVVNNKLYVIGGMDKPPHTVNLENEEFDPTQTATNQWASKTNVAESHSMGDSGAVYNGEVWLMGGSSDNSSYTNLIPTKCHDVDSYDPSDDTYTVRGGLLCGVGYARTGVVGDSIYVVGGRTLNADIDVSQFMQIYDPSDESVSVAHMPLRWAEYGMDVYSSKLYLLGGIEEAGTTAGTRFYEFDPSELPGAGTLDTAKWTEGKNGGTGTVAVQNGSLLLDAVAGSRSSSSIYSATVSNLESGFAFHSGLSAFVATANQHNYGLVSFGTGSLREKSNVSGEWEFTVLDGGYSLALHNSNVDLSENPASTGGTNRATIADKDWVDGSIVDVEVRYSDAGAINVFKNGVEAGGLAYSGSSLITGDKGFAISQGEHSSTKADPLMCKYAFVRKLAATEPSISVASRVAIGARAQQVIVSDSFDRANSETLGSTDSYAGGTSKAWTEVHGDWKIASNKLVTDPPQGGGTILYLATLDAGVADVEVRATVNVANNAGIMLRWDGTDGLMVTLETANNAIKIYELSDSAATQIATTAVTLSNGVDYELVAIAHGSTIIGYVDGANKVAATTAKNLSSTTIGFRDRASGGQFNNLIVYG